MDDVNFYNLGFTGYFQHYASPTPNIDRLSQESYTLWNAHCNIPFCQQSRMVLLTGLYSQNNGALNFNPIKQNIKTLPLILKNNGFYTHIIGKVSHHEPDSCFSWDQKQCFWKSNILDYVNFYSNSKKNNFFLINLENTHRPFHFDFTNGIAFEHIPESLLYEIIKIKSKEKKPQFEGKIPSSLPDTAIIREDIYSFFKSLKKSDDIIGDIMSLTQEEDIVVLTSDHGFSFPYFKGNCYGSSTNIPLMIKSKYILKKNDKNNLVSHVDFMPTILDLLNIKTDILFDGKSYMSILKGKNQDGFDFIYSQLNKMATGGNSRIRAVTDANYTYCINLDPHNSQCVDGWGWHDIIQTMEQSGKSHEWNNRPFEELIQYSKMDTKKSNNILIQKKLKIKLFDFMEKYQDTELNTISQKMNFDYKIKKLF